MTCLAAKHTLVSQDASYMENPAEVLDSLFNKAKARDEFEYVCALLRISGAQDAGWDPLEESQRAIRDYIALIEAPLRSDTRLRLALLVYSHIVEVDAVYAVIENMLNIIEGERCSISPLARLYQRRKKAPLLEVRPPSARKVISYLKGHAEKSGEARLAKLLEDMFDEEVRNAFSHSDYIIYEGEFRIRHGFPKAIKLSRIEELINNALNFFQAFLDVWTQHRLGYKEPKVVRGRIGHEGQLEDIELLVHPTVGVYGFRTPPASESPASARGPLYP